MPAPARTLPAWVFYGLALSVVLLDQVVKAWARAALPLGGTLPLWPGVFHLTHTQNKGMAFSLLEGKTFLLAAAAILVAGVIVAAQRRMGARLPLLLGCALALPLGGALGNLIDRLWQGYVTDLFDFRLINFPVFNVADSAITVGIALLVWRTLTTKEPG
jgi:signal peptidase II